MVASSLFPFIFNLSQYVHQNESNVTPAIDQHLYRNIIQYNLKVFILTADILYSVDRKYVLCIDNVLVNTYTVNLFDLTALKFRILLWYFIGSNSQRFTFAHFREMLL